MKSSLNLVLLQWTLFLSFISWTRGVTFDAGRLSTFDFVDDIQVEGLPHVLRRRSVYEHLNVSSGAPDLFRLSFQVKDRRYFLHLQPNPHLISPSTVAEVYGPDGQLMEQFPVRARAYHGRVLPEENSEHIFQHGSASEYLAPFSEKGHQEDLGWAAVTFLDVDHDVPLMKRSFQNPTFEGVFMVDEEMFTIKTTANYRRFRRPHDIAAPSKESNTPQMIVYRESDRESVNPDRIQHSCGHDHLDFNRHGAKLFYQRKREELLGEQSGINIVNSFLKKRDGSSGCPTSTKVLFMGMAGDCTYITNYGGQDKALQQIVSNMNQASMIYQLSFKIALSITKINLQTGCGNNLAWNRPCDSGYLISDRLSDFSQWRGQQGGDISGLWHLMTQCSSGSTVGISWLNMVCTTNAFMQNNQGRTEYVSGTGVTSVHPNEWLVLAHEIGHSFGAIHDCTDSGNCNDGSCCPCGGGGSRCGCGGQFIMNPTSDVRSTQFSPCSINTVCEKSGTIARCIAEPGSQPVITGQMCGNGIKEAGEQCDCGPADGNTCKNDPCCDGSTCKLKPGAACADFNDGCCQKCQVRPANVVCRPSRGTCDVPESCDGKSGSCPPDRFVDDSTTCQINANIKGKCASGTCTSRDYQCQLRGTEAGVTKECPGYSDQCLLYCQGPQIGTCLKISGFYMDGTPCGYNGKCEKGVCQTDFIGSIIGWFMAHLGVGIVILIIVFILVLGCIFRCCQLCRAKRLDHTLPPSNSRAAQRRANVPIGANMLVSQSRPMQSLSPGVKTSPHRQQLPPTPQQQRWVDPALYNGVFNGEEVDLSSLEQPLPPSRARGPSRSGITQVKARSPTRMTENTAWRDGPPV